MNAPHRRLATARPPAYVVPPPSHPIEEHMPAIEAVVMKHYGCTADERALMFAAFLQNPREWGECMPALYREILDGNAGPPAQ